MCAPSTFPDMRSKPSIFWAFWHPHKTILDILITFLFSLFLPLTALSPPKQLPEKEIEDAHAKHAQSMREKMDTMLLKDAPRVYGQLAEAAGCEIVETTLNVARRDDLLDQWGIELPKEYKLPSPARYVKVHVAFPATLLPEGVEKPTETNEVGCLALKDDKILEKLDKGVPVVVFFHGGGFIMGNSRMSEGINLLQKAMEGRETKNFIFAAVEYSLAPEHPFPVPPLEACSVTQLFLEEAKFEQVHLLGVSAGAAHVLAAGLESYRANQPKALKSVVAMCPCLDPACDTLSYYQNQSSSYMCPVDWLRYCFRLYFQLLEPDDKGEEDLASLNDLLGRGSNRQAWQASQWFDPTKGIRRWAQPSLDVPKFASDGPLFLLTTNAGDPLMNDGMAMADALQAAGAKLSYHKHKGTHYFGSMLDPKGFQKLAQEWGDVIFA